MDPKQLTQFVTDSFNTGNTVLALALGNELGLFSLMSDLDIPFTSQELADAGSFKERYIKEWLCGMACSRIIDYNVDKGDFTISRENLDVLIQTTSTSCLGLLALSGARHELLKTTFRNDGPNGFPICESLQHGPLLDSFRKNHFWRVLDDEILKISSLKQKFESGICVADIACGAGRMALLMAQRFPKSTVWALDIDDDALEIGRKRAQHANIQNIVFQQADAHNISKSMYSKFDFIFTYDSIHDLPHPGKAINEIYKSLKDGGIFSMMEPHAESNLVDNVKASNGCSLYMISLYWCLPHSLSTPGGEGYGRAMGKDRMLSSLKAAGFSNIKVAKSVCDPDTDSFLCQK